MLRPWNYHIELDASSPLTIHHQLVTHFQTLIRQGSWLAGTSMPSTRDLAKNLGINRKTVAKVYEELSAKGWIYTEPKRGTFVADHTPNTRPILNASTKNLTHSESHTDSQYAQKITQLMQKEMVKLTRRAALYMHKASHESDADAGGLMNLRELIAQLLIHELKLNTTPASVLCHHNNQILYHALIEQLKARGHYLLVDETCPVQDKNTLREYGFSLLEIPSQPTEINHLEAFTSTTTNTNTRTLSLDTIEKYCINYPVAALWINADTENHLGQALHINQSIKARLQQFDVLLVEDHRNQFISHNPNFNGKYIPENTVIIGALYGQRHQHVDINYLVLPQTLSNQTLHYLQRYQEPQSLLNAQIQYEFIKHGHYKKLSQAWENLLKQRHQKLSLLLETHGITDGNSANGISNSVHAIQIHRQFWTIKAVTKQALYLNQTDDIGQAKNSNHASQHSRDSLNAGLNINFEYLKIENLRDKVNRLNYSALDETSFIRFYVALAHAIENAYEPKTFYLKAG